MFFRRYDACERTDKRLSRLTECEGELEDNVSPWWMNLKRVFALHSQIRVTMNKLLILTVLVPLLALSKCSRTQSRPFRGGFLLIK